MDSRLQIGIFLLLLEPLIGTPFIMRSHTNSCSTIAQGTLFMGNLALIFMLAHDLGTGPLLLWFHDQVKEATNLNSIFC